MEICGMVAVDLEQGMLLIQAMGQIRSAAGEQVQEEEGELPRQREAEWAHLQPEWRQNRPWIVWSYVQSAA